MIQLDIFSDPICPWCYIGKANLDAALAEVAGNPFQVRWLPFMLNPDMPAEGIARRDYVERKFGSRENILQVHMPMVEKAEEIGLPLNLEAITRTPSTIDAHRLIHWAGLEERQNSVVSGLFTAYFQDGRDIGDHDVLADVADSAGLDASLILRLLATDEDRREIVERDAAARGMGVNSVPTFIVASQHAVPGAQPKELWLKVIEELMTGAAPQS